MPTNPVLASSSLPHDLPNFAAISDDDFLPAFRDAMTAQLAEVDAITADPRPASFANTIEALERSGQALARAAGVFFNVSGSDANSQRNEIAATLAAELSTHEAAIAMNTSLFARINAVRDVREALDEPAQRLLNKRYDDAVRAGAALNDEQRARIADMSTRLAVLETTFGQRLLDGMNDAAVQVDSVEELDGLSASAIAAAQALGDGNGYRLALDLPTSQSALVALTNPQTRAKVFAASVDRCGASSRQDTSELLLEIVRLRAQRAEMLGYPSHADYIIDEQTAPDIASVRDLLHGMAASAMTAGGKELTRLTEFAGEHIAASDMTYWLERERLATATADLASFADYCELDTVLTDGVFYAAGALYGVRFVARPDLGAYHDDVRVFEVFDSSGSSRGLYLGDFFARPSKRGGAWMNSIVDQSKLLGNAPVVINVCNFAKPAAGEPALLSLDEITTLFHEFGHTLHGLLSDVTYPSQSGTSVPRDFVEFPSQVNEMWALHPQVLSRYARHYRTGATIPEELAEAARASVSVESAHSTIEYLGAALLDLAWHSLSADEAAAIDDVDAFEERALRDAGIAAELIPPRYRSRYFNHIFAGGYSAGYYSYMWSEVLDAETVRWFDGNGGLTAANGRRFADATLSRGDSVDPIAAHEAMVGHARDTVPLLRRRGFAAT